MLCDIGRADLSYSAAELRAAAAELRLAGIAGPSSGVKSEVPALVPMKDDGDDDDETDDDLVDVPDPHMGAEERKREMEGEMNQAERRDLRGGYEEYVEAESKPPGKGVKREVDTDQTFTDPPPAKRGTTVKPSFGADLIKQERLRSLGMAQTTLSTSANTLGKQSIPRTSSVTSTEAEAKPAVSEDWTCQLCTFVNVADRGRCGESPNPAAFWGWLIFCPEMCEARPDGSMPSSSSVII